MKFKRITLLAVALASHLLASQISTAAVILDIAGPDTAASLGFADNDLSDGIQGDAFAVSWSFDRAFSNVSISTPLVCPQTSLGDPNDPFSVDQAACSGEMFLMRGEVGSSGPGDIVSAGEFNGDALTPGESNTFFSGLNLGAGVYHLVLAMETTFGVWGATDPANVTQAAGINHLSSWFTGDYNGGQPWLSDEPNGWGRVSAGGGFAEYYYTLTADEMVSVSEPGAGLLLLLGVAGLAGVRSRSRRNATTL